MTQVNTDIIQAQGNFSPAEAKEKARLAAVRKKRVQEGDRIVKAPATLGALQAREGDAAGDPLAALPPAREQPGDNGDYYPPIGMPAIFFLMKAEQTNLEAGLYAGEIDNRIMKTQLDNWIAEMMNYAKQTKNSLMQQAHESLLQGISSAVAAGISGVSLGGSAYELTSGESKIGDLNQQKAETDRERFDLPTVKSKAAAPPKPVGSSSGPSLSVEAKDDAVPTSSASPTAVGAGVRSAEDPAAPAEPGAPAKSTVEERRDLADGPVIDPKKRADLPLSVQRDAVLDEMMNETKGSARYNRLKLKLQKIEQWDKKLAVKSDEQKREIDQAITKSQQRGQMWISLGSLGQALVGPQGMATGIGGVTFKQAQANAEYQKAMADTEKQRYQLTTNEYLTLINKVYQSLEGMLQEYGSSMRALYAAQQNGG